MQQRHMEANQKGGNHAIEYVLIARNRVVLGIYLCVGIYRDSSVRIQGDNIITKNSINSKYLGKSEKRVSEKNMYDSAHHPLHI